MNESRKKYAFHLKGIMHKHRGGYPTWYDNKKKKWGEFQWNPFNLFHSGMVGEVVIIPIQVIKTSLCMCQRTGVFPFFCRCTGSPKHQHITNQFPYISLYSHLILSQCWWELEHRSLYTGIYITLWSLAQTSFIIQCLGWIPLWVFFSPPLFVGNKGKVRL